jgi:sugar phosphate isomerase/epimerase
MLANGVLGVGLSVDVKDPNWRDLPAAIDEAAALGCDLVELPLHKLDIVMGARIHRARLADIREIVRARAVGVTLHGHLAINLMDDAHRHRLHVDVLKANVEIAAELGAIHLVMHSGFVRRGAAERVEEAYARQRDTLREIGAFAAGHGVVVCVENIFEFDGARITALPSRLAAELAAVDHPNVMATFDFGHGYLHCGMMGADFLTEAKALAPFAKHLHVHDCFGRPKEMWAYTVTEELAFGIGDLHLPLGWGDLPFERIAAEAQFPHGVVADIELQYRYWSEVRDVIAATRDFAMKLDTRARRAEAA